ncbi:MAG: molecular chaperone GrpE [Thermoleophilaceae bacterium]|jgi:molecular chaperone GrpE|nr:molecular chaperone GrpE [Thermoleophilaceae bacterium]
MREELSDSAPQVQPDTDGGNVDGGTEAVVDAPPAAEPAEVPEPEDELTIAQRERNEYLELAKRTQADFENYRKRAAKDAAAAGSRARIGLIREFLPVLDNLERALGVAPEGAHDAFVEGVRLVHRDLQGALARAGVQTIEPEGQAFDPNVHEALSTRPQEGAAAGTVLDVIEKGYRTADIVVRPARVVVAS